MRTIGRAQAAIEILTEILDRHRPASDALAEWGRTHRFAGSGDRAAIGNLVYDALRRRSSLAHRMNSEQPRALVLALLPSVCGLTTDEIATAADGSAHAIAPLAAEERSALDAADVPAAADWIAADVPEWLAPSLARAFGGRLVTEGQALAQRAPVDLRVNRLKAEREKVLKALADQGAAATRWSPHCVRIPAPTGLGRTPNIEAETSHGKGWFEVQDEGSQIAALLARVGPRMQVLDLCAGAGGKTLALAAEMQNTGQIYAYDSDKAQLRPIFERLKRAGVRNAQVLEAGDEAALMALGARFDVVFVDAPCTGSGVWRRRPDAKWRVRPEALALRLEEQASVLALARGLVKPGGRLIYVTCSLLPEENGDQIEHFLRQAPEFEMQDHDNAWRAALFDEPPLSPDGATRGLLLTPAQHATDGFYVATMQRQP